MNASLRAFLMSLPLPVTGVDGEGRVVLWNGAAEAAFGWRAEEVIGRALPTLPDDRRGEHERLRERAFRGEAAARVETVRVRRDGSVIDVVMTAVPVRGNSGEIEAAVALFHDLGADGLSEQRRMLLLLEQMPAIVSTFDRDFTFTSMRGAGLRTLGSDAEAMIGKTLYDIGAAEGSQPIETARAALRGESSRFEWTYNGRAFENRIEPLRDQDGEITGLINLGIDVTERRAAEAALSESREQLRRLAIRAQQAQEEDRRRIARELHDELGQSLTALRYDLGLLRGEVRRRDRNAIDARIRSMDALIDANIQAVRRVATELRPSLLDDIGFRAAIENELAAFEKRTSVAVALVLPADDLDLPRDVATALYRILQEALTNVARHSGATHVELRIDHRDGRIDAELRDDGRGITDEQARSGSTLGLLGMRERAYAVGGQLTIERIAAGGTRLHVSIPT